MIKPETLFYLATMGCKINQYETQAIREGWLARGAVETGDPALAGVILINSCAVTARAIRDLRQSARRFRRQNPGAEIIVAGCAAQVLRDELGRMEEIDRIAPQESKVELIGLEGGGTGWADFSISDYDRSRAVVKVQDGCSHHCAYCIVPLARGGSRSRAPQETLAEIRRLLEAGFRELILSGVNLRQYGRDLSPRHDFWELVQFLERELAPEWAGQARFRLSSLEPGQLAGPDMDRVLEVFAASRMLCPHLHLSLQSASPEVLKGMGRAHYRPQNALLFLERLGEALPMFGLGADLLVGFPGESEDMFEETLDFCRGLPLTYAHVFPYSKRPGTRAAVMEGQIPAGIKKERAARLRELAARKKKEFMVRSLGLKEMRIALQSVDPAGGVNEYYSPCRLIEPPVGLQAKEIVRVAPLGVEGGLITARLKTGPGRA